MEYVTRSLEVVITENFVKRIIWSLMIRGRGKESTGMPTVQ